jgi:Ca2+-transporting ATPase
LGITGEREKTALFTLFVVFQLFNAFNARELGSDSAFATLLKNKPMLIVMLITFGLQLLITQVGTAVFNTVPLGGMDWLKILAMGLSLVVFNELYKPGILLYRRVKAKRSNG